MWIVAGKDALIRLPFSFEQEPVIPDANSVKLTVRDNVGQVIAGYDRMPLVVDSTFYHLTLPSTVNSLGASLFESRFLTVEFAVNSVPQTVELSYSISQYIPLSTSAMKVRGYLGVLQDELPDSDIDLHESYFELLQDFQDLPTWLTTGGHKQMAANQAVALKAALKAIPSLQLRVLAVDKSDVAEFQRLKNIDFNKLEMALLSQIEKALSTASDSVETVPTLMVVTSPTDPVTG